MTTAVGPDTRNFQLKILDVSVELEEGRCGFGGSHYAAVEGTMGEGRKEIAAETVRVVGKAFTRS